LSLSKTSYVLHVVLTLIDYSIVLHKMFLKIDVFIVMVVNKQGIYLKCIGKL